MTPERDRTIFRYLLAFCVVIAGAIGVQLVDDPLSPEVETMLEAAFYDGESEAYYYLLGINAAPDEDPGEVGRELFESIQYAEQLYDTAKEELDYEHYPLEKAIPLPEGNFFCHTWKDGCLEAVFSGTEQYGEILRSHQALLERYRKFLLFSEYRTLSRPAFHEPLPSYSYLVRAIRLSVIEALSLTESQGGDKALERMLIDISSLRRSIALQDSLIGKTLAITALSESIDFASILAQRGIESDFNSLPPLSADEKDMFPSMARELAMIRDAHISLANQKGDIWPIIFRLVYKENISTNDSYPIFLRATYLDDLKSSDFAKHLEHEEDSAVNLSWIRNPVGSYITNISNISYDEYVGRVHNVDAKISLFNVLLRNEGDVSILSSVANPFYPDTKSALMSEDGARICFDGPLEDQRNLRCLPIDWR